MARTIKQEIKVLEKKLETNPKSTLFVRLADVYLKNEQVDKAIDICEQGLRFHPFYATGHYLMAKCYLARGDYDHAKAELDRTLKFDPFSLVANKLMGDMYKITRNQNGFQASYKRLWEIDPLNQSLSKLVEEMGLKVDEPTSVDTSDVEILVPRQDESGELIQPSIPRSVRVVEPEMDMSTGTEEETSKTTVENLIDDAFRMPSSPVVKNEPTFAPPPSGFSPTTFTGSLSEPHEVDEVINRAKRESDLEATAELVETKEEGTFSSILADIFGNPPASSTPASTSVTEVTPVPMAPIIKPEISEATAITPSTTASEKEISYDEFMALQAKEKIVSHPSPEPGAVKATPAAEFIEPAPEPRHAPKTATISTAKGETKIVSATLGEIYISQGQFEAALQIFKALAAVDPDSTKYQRKIKQLEDILVQEKNV